MMETEFRDESIAMAQTIKAHAAEEGTHGDAVRAGVAAAQSDRQLGASPGRAPSSSGPIIFPRSARCSTRRMKR